MRIPASLPISLTLGVIVSTIGIIGSAEGAQSPTGTIRVEAIVSTAPLAGTSVSAGGASATTNASGVATLTLPAGPVELIATHEGYEPSTVRASVVAGTERAIRVVMTPAATGQGPVLATPRNGLNVEDQAHPVTLLDRTRVETAMLRSPADVRCAKSWSARVG